MAASIEFQQASPTINRSSQNINGSDSQIHYSSSNNLSSNASFGPKLSIKLQDSNFLLWNQQVEGVITTHKLHRFVVNPQISMMYKSETDRQANIVSEEYEAWIVQDQALFTWLLSTISESVLPRVLSCKHACEVWDKIHRHFHALMKARARQLRSELKSTKKANRSISEFVLRIKAIADQLLAIGDPISEQDQVDAVLDGLLEEYSNFVMMIYGRIDSPSLYDIEALLYVKEAQLDKFRQELSISNATANVAHTGQGQSQGSHGFRGGNQTFRGRGRSNHGRGRSRGRFTGNGTCPTCQLYGKYGHAVVNCWYRYDESFVPQAPVPQASSTATHPASGQNPGTGGKQDVASTSDQGTQPSALLATQPHPMAYTQELALPSGLDSQAWFADSGI